MTEPAPAGPRRFFHALPPTCTTEVFNKHKEVSDYFAIWAHEVRSRFDLIWNALTKLTSRLESSDTTDNIMRSISETIFYPTIQITPTCYAHINKNGVDVIMIMQSPVAEEQIQRTLPIDAFSLSPLGDPELLKSIINMTEERLATLEADWTARAAGIGEVADLLREVVAEHNLKNGKPVAV